MSDPIVEKNHTQALSMLSDPEVDFFSARAVIEGADLSNYRGEFNFKTPSMLWQKEALINKAVTLLQGQYDAVTWIDSGIHLEPGWAKRILDALETCDVVQCYFRGVWLNRWGGVHSYRSGYIHDHSQGIEYQRSKPKPSVGAAWAARSSVFSKMQLYDRAIVGGGDTWVLNGLLGVDTPEALVTRNISGPQKRYTKMWVRNTRMLKLKVGYTGDTYTHLWHLDKVHRQHETRHRILRQYDFDPETHIQLGKSGLIEWTPKAPLGLVEGVKSFFERRVGTPKKIMPPAPPS